MGLAEDDLEEPSALRTWITRALIGALVITVVGGVGYGLKGLFKAGKAPRQQISTIKLVPDTPPPPPPKPKEEPKKEEPKEQKEMKVDQPKPVEAPQQTQQLKSDEAPGQGEGGIVAGNVSNTDLSTAKFGPDAGPPKRTSGVDRAAWQAYKRTLESVIQKELLGNKELNRSEDFRVPVKLARDGTDGPWTLELEQATGVRSVDDILRRELTRILSKNPPPASGAPDGGFFRIAVSNRMIN